ncbi:MAG: hypothetical protein C7B46_13055 [Sulfobacillus benefaciens]|uniref:Aspartate racemase n=1 Tax=Sulfobacillus benefaciens TaxID=453960 RepID=A0A2T2XDU7_9FIRM|nr:MAG: hypothetical protein C7B46_13055 [Sulfobacillus benefaciens]
MKPMGIIGGLGPLEGAYFYRRLGLTSASDAQAHLPGRLFSTPEIPSRTAHLKGHGPSLIPTINHTAQALVDAGATLLVIPSSTPSITIKRLPTLSAYRW